MLQKISPSRAFTPLKMASCLYVLLLGDTFFKCVKPCCCPEVFFHSKVVLQNKCPIPAKVLLRIGICSYVCVLPRSPVLIIYNSNK